jgi:hypothetical protein
MACAQQGCAEGEEDRRMSAVWHGAWTWLWLGWGAYFAVVQGGEAVQAPLRVRLTQE